MGGRVGKFVVGAVLIGASLLISGPGIWAAGTQLLKGLLFSAGASLVTGAFIPSPIRQRQGAIQLNVADNLAPLPLVYGEEKIGLRLVDIRTSGPDNRDLYIVGALCHGSIDGTGIDSIREVFFDDRLAINALGQIQAPWSSDNFAMWKNLGTDIQEFDGTLNGEFPSSWPTTSKGRGVAYVVFKMIYNPELFPTGIPNITCIVRGAKVNDYRNGKIISSWGATGANVTVTTSTAHGLATGDSVTIYQNGEIATGISAAMKLYRRTVVVVNSTQFTLTGQAGQGGYVANSASVVEAAYSTNPAMCVGDYLTSPVYGLKAAITDIDLTSLNSSASYCDTVITKHSSFTGPRYSCNGWIDVGQPSQENIRQLLTSCRGNFVYENGKYRMFIRQPGSPVAYALTEANTHGDWSFNTPGVKDCANSARITYVEPGKGPYILAISNVSNPVITTLEKHGFDQDQVVYIHQVGATAQGLTTPLIGVFKVRVVLSDTTFSIIDMENQDIDPPGTGYNISSCQVTTENFPYQPETKIWPIPGTANGFLTADNNYEVTHDYDLPCTKDQYTAIQIGMISLRESRATVGVTITASEDAIQLVLGDIVNVTYTTPGWVAKPFWVMSVFLLENGLVSLGLIEYDVNAYNLDVLNTTPTPPSTKLPDPFAVLPVTELDLVSADEEATPDLDGSTRMYIHARWIPPEYPYIDYYEVQYKRSGTSTWIPSGDPSRADDEALVGPVSEGISYDVQVRVINTIGRASAWVSETIVPHVNTSGRHGNSWFIDDFTSATPGRRWIQTAGAGSIVDHVDPDSLVGGKVGRATGEVALEHKDAIPFDPNIYYHMRIRCRQYRNSVVGVQQFSAGFNALAQVPGQPGVFSYVNVFGQNSLANQHYVLANHVELGAGRTWQDFIAHVKGFAGDKVPLDPTMLSHVGLLSFDATKLVNGSVDPLNIGFDAASAAIGAALVFDLGEAEFVTDAWMHMATEGSTDGWDLEFADSSGGPWTKINEN